MIRPVHSLCQLQLDESGNDFPFEDIVQVNQPMIKISRIPRDLWAMPGKYQSRYAMIGMANKLIVWAVQWVCHLPTPCGLVTSVKPKARWPNDNILVNIRGGNDRQVNCCVVLLAWEITEYKNRRLVRHISIFCDRRSKSTMLGSVWYMNKASESLHCLICECK